jgi:O-antigen ligase
MSRRVDEKLRNPNTAGTDTAMMKFVRLCLYGVLLTPLLVNTSFSVSFNTPKVLAFQILVELALVVACSVEWFSSSRGPARKSFAGLASFSPFAFALGVFLAYSFIAAAFAVDFRRSLWGLEDRQDGLVLLLHFYGFFLVAVWFAQRCEVRGFAKPEAQKGKGAGQSGLRFIDRYLNFSYWVSSVAALSALYFWAVTAHDPTGWLGSTLLKGQGGTRSGGLMGNPEYLGPYLLFHIFYGLHYFQSDLRRLQSARSSGKRKSETSLSRGRARLVFIIVVELILFLAVFVGQTRGIVMGMALGLMVAGLGWVSRHSSRVRILSAASCLALVLLGGFAFWRLRDSTTAMKIPLFRAFVEVANPESGTRRVRLLLWQSALAGFKDRPVFGWGHDNAFYALNQHYNPELVRFVYADIYKGTWSDKSHNAFLDLLVEKGAVGALLFLIVVAVLGSALWRLRHHKAAWWLTAGFAAYAVAVAVSFDSFGSLMGLFLFFAWFELESHRDLRSTWMFGWRGSGTSERKGYPSGWGRATSPLIVASCLCGLYLNVEIGLASTGCQEAQAVISVQPRAGLALYEDALQHFYPYQDKQKLQCAALLIQSVVQGPRGPDDQIRIDSALRLGREAVSAHPHDAYLCLWFAVLQTNLGINVDKKYLDGGAALGERALALSPLRQEVMVHLGRTYVLRSEFHRAAEVNRKMVEAYPAYALAHWYYGLSLIKDSQLERAKMEIRTALDLGYHPQDSDESQIVKKLLGT